MMIDFEDTSAPTETQEGLTAQQCESLIQRDRQMTNLAPTQAEVPPTVQTPKQPDQLARNEHEAKLKRVLLDLLLAGQVSTGRVWPMSEKFRITSRELEKEVNIKLGNEIM